MNNFIFFLSATLIVVLSIAAFGTGPVINNLVGGIGTFHWGVENCQLLADEYEDDEKEWEKMDDGDSKNEEKKELDRLKQQINSCKRRKAFYGLEYSALIIDICGGFICSILGLLLYLNEGKSFATKTGLIGLVFGAVGFVMTLVYLIYSILVYTKDGSIPKTDEDGSFASWDNSKGKYVCKFYKKNDYYSTIAKYSEYGKKQYNYNKDDYMTRRNGIHSERYGDVSTDSSSSPYTYKTCIKNYIGHDEFITDTYLYDLNSKTCNKIYTSAKDNDGNKCLRDRWLTTMILSAIIILCSICLALFGFLIFKNKEGSNGGDVKVV